MRKPAVATATARLVGGMVQVAIGSSLARCGRPIEQWKAEGHLADALHGVEPLDIADYPYRSLVQTVRRALRRGELAELAFPWSSGRPPTAVLAERAQVDRQTVEWLLSVAAPSATLPWLARSLAHRR
jgi:hypothetical protein